MANTSTYITKTPTPTHYKTS